MPLCWDAPETITGQPAREPRQTPRSRRPQGLPRGWLLPDQAALLPQESPAALRCGTAMPNSRFARAHPIASCCLAHVRMARSQAVAGKRFWVFLPEIVVAMLLSMHMLLEIKWIIKSTEVTHTQKQSKNNLRKVHGRNSITRLPEKAGASGRTAGFEAAFFSLEIHKT